MNPYKHGSAYAAAQIHLWLSGDRPTLLDDSPQFGPLWQWCLAHNIAWGAALCRAYETPRWRWQPGCGKAAP